MTEDSRQNASHTTDILQSSSLVQRLDQRRTEPVGLIDGHQFQSRSARLPTTVVQRFALLDQLQTRYGIRDRSVAPSMSDVPRGSRPEGDRNSGTSTELTSSKTTAACIPKKD